VTNVFVHFLTDDGQLKSDGMLFSRAPVAGEVVYVDDNSYEVMRVDHHPGRNVDQSGSRATPFTGVPEDVDIWLIRKDVPPNPFYKSA